MNLIEQLGWYNAAKAEANAPVKLMNSFSYEQLDKELLEYRRENGVFEVGDKVVFNSYELDAGIREIQDYHNGCIGAVFRHATDEEIKAGVRI